MYITFTYNSTIDTYVEILLIFTLQNVFIAGAEDCLQSLQLADIFFSSPVFCLVTMISTVTGFSDSFRASAFLPPPRQTAH